MEEENAFNRKGQNSILLLPEYTLIRSSMEPKSPLTYKDALGNSKDNI